MRDITKQREMMNIINQNEKAIEKPDNYITICANCSLIHDKAIVGKPWLKPAAYFSDRFPELKFSHSICPKCVKELYPDIEI